MSLLIDVLLDFVSLYHDLLIWIDLDVLNDVRYCMIQDGWTYGYGCITWRE
jgi:hypothetical protein